MNTIKLANSIWDLPGNFEQESFFGATDEEWTNLCDGVGEDFMPFNVVSWEYGDDELEVIIMEDGSVHAVLKDEE